MTSFPMLIDQAIRGQDNRDWYKHANRNILSAARSLGICPWRLTCLLGLYSPRVQVSRSIRFALHYAKTGKHMPDVTRSIASAVNHWSLTGEIRGPKTSEFVSALALNPNTCVLDTWMATALKIDQNTFERKGVRFQATKRIAKVAEFLEWTPTETQAAIWATAVSSRYNNVPKLEIKPYD